MNKKIIKKLIEGLGYSIVSNKYLHPLDIYSNNDFIEIYNRCKPFIRSVEKSYDLYNAVNYVVDNNIAGDFVECGVWKGGQPMLMALSALKKNNTHKTLWLYDTYAGMSEPTDFDIRVGSGEPAKENWNKSSAKDYNKWEYAPLEEVRKNVISTGYPETKINFIKGKVENTIPDKMPEIISILRLDTDWYESTLHELEYLYPRLVTGGVLIIDDYGSWDGSRKAVDEYIQENNLKILLSRSGFGRMAIKQ